MEREDTHDVGGPPASMHIPSPSVYSSIWGSLGDRTETVSPLRSPPTTRVAKKLSIFFFFFFGGAANKVSSFTIRVRIVFVLYMF